MGNAAPELWDAATGRRSPVASKPTALGAEVSLTLPPFGATFVVFDAAHRVPAGQAPDAAKFAEVLELKGPWTVDFAPMASCDKPFTLTMETLTPWNLHADRNVRYFAGRATYRGSFSVDAPMLKRPLRLDLGPALGDVAEVKVNGKPAGSLWMPPYQVDVSGMLKPGENQLEIVVANRWINRLLGELQTDPLPPAMQRNPFKKKETPLVEAGLIGPVKLSAGER